MKKKILVIAVAVVLGFGMIVTPALAVTNFTDFQQAQQTKAANGNGFGKYFAGTMHATVAGSLGLTDDELYALRVEGKSIAQIASEKGITTESLTSTLTLSKIDQINKLYNDGTITVEQKDLMISNAEVRTIDKINRTEIGSQGYGNKGQNKGMRGNQDGTFVKGQGNVNGGGLGLNINNQ